MSDVALMAEEPTTARRSLRGRWWSPLAVFVAAFLVRLYNIGAAVNFLDDRFINVPAALNYGRYGFTGPDNWFTQPAKHLFMYWDILMFGDTPVAWSMRQVLFGAGVAVLTYLLARRVFRAEFPAIMAAALVVLDPLWIVFSRAGSEDPPAVFFMLAAMLFFVRGLDEDRDLDWLASGLLMGVAVATRWYALLVGVLALLIALIVKRRDGLPALARMFALLALAPACSYVVWYLPWLARGYSMGDLANLHFDAYRVQASGAYPTFDPALARLTQPLGWFVRWIGVGVTPRLSGTSGTFTVMMNDPLLWALTVPAVAYVAWRGYQRGRPAYWLVAGSFIVLYAFFAGVRRPIYLYSALAILPMGFAALGYAAGRLLKRWSLPLLAVMIAWSVYLYPLTSAVMVPLAPYSWLLKRVGLL